MTRNAHWLFCCAALVLLCCCVSKGVVAQPGPAPRPPLGWNSWDSYGLTIDEAQFRANAEILAAKLAPFGWDNAVIDEGWYFRNPEDRRYPEALQYELDLFGRFVPAPARYPGSAGTAPIRQDGQSFLQADGGSLRFLGDWLHSRGLRFGIHIIRGIPKESVRMNLPVADSPFHAADAADRSETCPWDPTSYGVRDNAAGQAWYDALIAQYAGWGVDFLKVDCIADHPYRASEIRQIHAALQKAGRPMLLSLSPGPTALEHMAEVTALAQMWRISDDLWDVWQSPTPNAVTVKSQFARLAEWARFAGPNHWPDADMLPLGRLSPSPDNGPGARATRLTPDEQQTLLTLWAVSRSPLIFGGNLTELDAPTLRLLTNRDLLRVNQTATSAKQILRDGDRVIWQADLPHDEQAVALFNLGEDTVPCALRPEYVHAKRLRHLRNVWNRTTDPNTCILPPHGSALFLTH